MQLASRYRRRLALLLALVFGLVCGGAHAQAPAAQAREDPNAGTVSASQWREDLAYMVGAMEARHADLYHSVDRGEFKDAVERLHARIPELQRHQVIVELMRLAAMVGDGHTNISPLKDPRLGFHELPVKLHWFDDGIHVRAAAPNHASLVGHRVEAVGDVTIEEAIERVARIVPHDNEMGLRFYAPIFIAMPEIQHALGLSDTPTRSRLTLVKGSRRLEVTLAAGEVPESWPPDTDISLVTPAGWVDSRQRPGPLWLQAPLDYHRMVPLPEHDALYVQLNMVTGTKQQSLDAFGAAILEQARATNPAVLVIDLRLNRGGNHDLRFPFIADMIKAEDHDTRLYILAGRGSFSATQRLLDDLANYSEAVLVGEPASSKPNSYGDSYKDTLPNSGIAFRTSMLWHQLDHRDLPWTPIDVTVPLTHADYAAGRDPVLEAALRQAVADDLPTELAAAAKQADAAMAAQAIDAYVRNPVNRYADWEQAFVGAILPLITPATLSHALAAAEEAAALLPASTRVLTILAFARFHAGNLDGARAAARRVVELDPNNRDVHPLLRGSRTGPPQ
jgi:tetratricopeptide (TPR) repeat protein